MFLNIIDCYKFDFITLFDLIYLINNDKKLVSENFLQKYILRRKIDNVTKNWFIDKRLFDRYKMFELLCTCLVTK